MRASSTSSASRTALVTGASSGIGRAIAEMLASKGIAVYGTSRNPDAIKPEDKIANVTYLPLDVTDAASVRACAKLSGPVDILVNNAGQSQLGPLEELDDAALEYLFEVNVIGQARVTREYLAGMRAAGNGYVVMIGSLAAEFPVPFQSAYAATKLAVRGMTQALRLEVVPFGISVSVVQPGYFRSGIDKRRHRVLREGSVYAPAVAAVTRKVTESHDTAGDPRVVAATVWRIVCDPAPAPVYSVGTHAPVLLLLKRLLSARGTERAVARRFKIQSRR
jgi:NAD(P)-dependent dehydrogenase (short-subunit alcohol dehydrogenase family)